MGAPEGNQFWKLRSKHGRDKIFATPEILWEAAEEYFEATSQRKWVKKDWVGKDAHEVDRETDTPFTISGLCIFLDCEETTLNDYQKLETHKDFHSIVTRIKRIIYTQKFEGASVGAYNANIISRDLGLKDHSDLTTDGEKLPAATFQIGFNKSQDGAESTD